MQRRRGMVLERAILRAAWEELAVTGYAKLTMEGVAARAETSKAVVYRRWPSRAMLVVAAMRQEAPALSGSLPDTGSLRGDVLALLRRVAARLRKLGPEAIHGLLTEGLQHHDFAADVDVRRVGVRTMRALMERAIARGELPPRTWKDRVLTLPLDLVRHEVLLMKSPPSGALLREIVDDVFLPAIHQAQVAAAGPLRA